MVTGTVAGRVPAPTSREGARGARLSTDQVARYLGECRAIVLDEIHRLLPRRGRCRATLYDLVLDYPLRDAKALRPALCIATCRALGGWLEPVRRSAAVLELYHNAFLIHDDVEDGSLSRRNRPTLHRLYGTPIAINVGDAMLALALEPLLENMRDLGLGRALRVMQVVARMARESAEGQALELAWIRAARWDLTDRDYVGMVHKKTGSYTFISPVVIGGIVAGATPPQLHTLRRFAARLGVAFQIQDDVLNLIGDEAAHGKDPGGDLWEGKHTLILMHALRQASRRDQATARRILRTSRGRDLPPPSPDLPGLLASLRARGDLTAAGEAALRKALRPSPSNPPGTRTAAETAFLRALIDRHKSIAYAQAVADRFAAAAARILQDAAWIEPSTHRAFLRSLVDFVVERRR